MNPVEMWNEIQDDFRAFVTLVIKRTAHESFKILCHRDSLLNFTHEHLWKPNNFWKNLLGFDKITIELFSHYLAHHIWRKDGYGFNRKTPPLHLSRGEGLSVCVCFYFNGTRVPFMTEKPMNGFMHFSILEANLFPSMQQV